MRPALLALALFATGCAGDATSSGDAPSETRAASRSYGADDRDTFCETVVTEAFVRDHFEVPADVPIVRSGSTYSCSGYWGGDTSYDPAATSYGFTVVIDVDEEQIAAAFANVTADRTAAENQAAVAEALGDAAAEQGDLGEAAVGMASSGGGGTATEAVGGLADEAAIVRSGESAPTVAFRLGNVLVTNLATYPVAWGREVDTRGAEMEARGVAFARALAAQM